jgi:hypothetical protein
METKNLGNLGNLRNGFVDIDMHHVIDMYLTRRNRRWRKNPQQRHDENVMIGEYSKKWVGEEVDSDDSIVDDDPTEEDIEREMEMMVRQIRDLEFECEDKCGDNEKKYKENFDRLLFEMIIDKCIAGGLTHIPLKKGFSDYRREYIEFDKIGGYTTRE